MNFWILMVNKLSVFLTDNFRRVGKSTPKTYFLSGCAASSGEGVPIWLIVAII